MSRNEFPIAVKRAASNRSEGRCECHLMSADIIGHFDKNCERRASEYDHIYADKLDGEPTIENCAHLSKACHLVKTALDRKYMAKRNKHKINRDRPDNKGPKQKMKSRKNPWPPNRKFQKRVKGESK